jgi:hypothetical protein
MVLHTHRCAMRSKAMWVFFPSFSLIESSHLFFFFLQPPPVCDVYSTLQDVKWSHTIHTLYVYTVKWGTGEKGAEQE